MENKECKICSCRPTTGRDCEYGRYESSVLLVRDKADTLWGGKDKNNKVFIWGNAGYKTIPDYYPKYCPECGRKLHD